LPGGFERSILMLSGSRPEDFSLMDPNAPANTSLPRAIVPGVTFVVLLALALQAAAGVLEPGLTLRHGHVEQARQVAAAVVNRLERVVRKQDVRPVAARPLIAGFGDAWALTCGVRAQAGVQARPLACHLIDLPPPFLS